MSFQLLSWPAVLAGLAALAGGLFLLQRLRVRHRTVQVPTLLFWREALEEAQARVLVERFRHPWAYLLTLAIASLLWLALAGPRSVGADDPGRVEVVVDGGAALALPQRAAALDARTRDLLGSLPGGLRRAVSAGVTPTTRLAPETPVRLYADLAPSSDGTSQSNGASPEPIGPSSLVRTLHALALEPGQTRALVVGERGLPPGLSRALAAVASSSQLVGVPTDDPMSPTSDGALVALGLAPALSGDPARVDLLVGTVGDAQPTVFHDGRTLPADSIWPQSGAGADARRRDHVFRDVPADGGLVAATLPAGAQTDGLAWRRAERRLPERGPLTVWIDPALPPAFAQALAGDPACEAVTEPAAAAVHLRVEGTQLESASRRPALVLASRATQEEPLLVTHAAEREPQDVLAALVPGLGLERLDSAALATALGVPFAVGARPAEAGEPIRLGLWAELFDPDGAALDQSRVFPVLLARTLDWLAERPALTPEFTAGRTLPATATWTHPEGLRAPALDGHVLPAAAGAWTTSAGAPVPVALLSAEDVAPRAPDATQRDAAAAALQGLLDELPGGRRDWAALLLALALVLLCAEWLLVRTGRMP